MRYFLGEHAVIDAENVAAHQQDAGHAMGAHDVANVVEAEDGMDPQRIMQLALLVGFTKGSGAMLSGLAKLMTGSIMTSFSSLSEGAKVNVLQMLEYCKMIYVRFRVKCMDRRWASLMMYYYKNVHAARRRALRDTLERVLRDSVDVGNASDQFAQINTLVRVSQLGSAANGMTQEQTRQFIDNNFVFLPPVAEQD